MVHAGLEAFYRHRHLGVTLEPADVCRRMLEAWGPTIDAENMTFESAEAEQALQQQAADLVTAYLGSRSRGREAAGRGSRHPGPAGRSGDRRGLGHPAWSA